MPVTTDQLFAFLDNLGIATKTFEHPALHTVAESQELRGQIAGAHTKNLFLKDKKRQLLSRHAGGNGERRSKDYPSRNRRREQSLIWQARSLDGVSGRGTGLGYDSGPDQ